MQEWLPGLYYPLFLKDDQPERALNYLNYLNQSNASKTIYSSTISLAEKIIEYKSKLNDDGTNVGLMNQIALNYYKMQNTDIALQYAEKAFALDRYNMETNELLRKIKSTSRQKLN